MRCARRRSWRRTSWPRCGAGQLAAIGRRTGVARVFGVNFSGFFAWWLWRTIYLSKLPRIEKKVRVAIDWTLDLMFAKDFVQFLTVRAPVQSTTGNAPDHEHVEYANAGGDGR
jgi:NADH dehydrogenase